MGNGRSGGRCFGVRSSGSSSSDVSRPFVPRIVDRELCGGGGDDSGEGNGKEEDSECFRGVVLSETISLGTGEVIWSEERSSRTLPFATPLREACLYAVESDIDSGSKVGNLSGIGRFECFARGVAWLQSLESDNRISRPGWTRFNERVRPTNAPSSDDVPESVGRHFCDFVCFGASRETSDSLFRDVDMPPSFGNFLKSGNFLFGGYPGWLSNSCPWTAALLGRPFVLLLPLDGDISSTSSDLESEERKSNSSTSSSSPEDPIFLPRNAFRFTLVGGLVSTGPLLEVTNCVLPKSSQSFPEPTLGSGQVVRSMCNEERSSFRTRGINKVLLWSSGLCRTKTGCGTKNHSRQLSSGPP